MAGPSHIYVNIFCLPQRSFPPNWSTFGGSAFYPPSPHPGLHPPIHLDFFGILLHGFAWICIILHNFVYCRIFCILLPTFPPCQVSISHDLTLIPANAIVSPSLKKSNTKNTKTIEMAGTHPIRSCSNKCLKFLGKARDKVIRKFLLSIFLYFQSQHSLNIQEMASKEPDRGRTSKLVFWKHIRHNNHIYLGLGKL